MWTALAVDIRASDDPTGKRVQLTDGAQDTYVLRYMKKGEGSVRVQIVDEQGWTVFSDHIRSQKAFKQPFNFKGMDEGTYEFRIADTDGVVKKKVAHRNNKSLPKAKVKALDEERYELSIVGNDFGTVYINVYDGYNSLLHSEAIDLNKSFKKVYNLSKAVNSGAVFEVYNSGEKLIAAKY